MRRGFPRACPRPAASHGRSPCSVRPSAPRRYRDRRPAHRRTSRCHRRARVVPKGPLPRAPSARHSSRRWCRSPPARADRAPPPRRCRARGLPAARRSRAPCRHCGWRSPACRAGACGSPAARYPHPRQRRRSCDRARLRGEDLVAADPREAEQAQQRFLVIGRVFGGRLRLGDMTVFEQHEIGVGVGVRILVIIEVEHRIALIDAARHRRDLLFDRVGGQLARGEQPIDRQPQRDPCARDRRGTRAAISLDHVAVERDLPLAEQCQVGDRAQAAPDQPLDLLRAPGLLALGGLAAAARVRGARQHPVFGGHPALALAAQERRQTLLDRGGDQHPGIAEADQHRAFGVAGEARLDGYRAHLVGGAAAGAHSTLLKVGSPTPLAGLVRRRQRLTGGCDAGDDGDAGAGGGMHAR
ncbi:hypothetical protein SPHINGO8AM_130240 [Sphingomonas sp. 8AM]|nr:hypothetical protein SPHINGO8AM_130240 [Sphingomonas sp. 8AM]